MPNWCYNYLSVEGPQEQIDKLKTQLNAPFEQSHDSWNPKTGDMEFKTVKYSEPVFAFHNIYNHIQDGVPFDVYHNSSNTRDPNMSVDETIAQIANEMANGQSWYDWNNRNWGTKWDVSIADGEEYSDTEIYDEQDNSIGYKFNTAWSPPLPAIEKLSQQYPDLEFTLSYEEETGWGGEVIFTNGESATVEDYESKCRECDELNTMEYCENDCGEICSACNYMGEADLDCVAECDIHKVYLDEDHVPDYRMDEINV